MDHITLLYTITQWFSIILMIYSKFLRQLARAFRKWVQLLSLDSVFNIYYISCIHCTEFLSTCIPFSLVNDLRTWSSFVEFIPLPNLEITSFLSLLSSSSILHTLQIMIVMSHFHKAFIFIGRHSHHLVGHLVCSVESH